MALTNEFLSENSARINTIIDRAEAMGDGAPALGVLILLALTEEEWAIYTSSEGDLNVIANILGPVEERFNSAGIVTR